ncbi:family 20 glycosylhydrolase [Spirochaeta lutea]|uniref:beta-N-acetylhexosaminidase n=1 Tax=Spirochaeta lutea TaxID=1480694 RepID=A0A098QWT3_9SPIO|nr:family 20 glycosylhydrolase [Spirochaeta lutea]KGE72041.1 hypothetical protein DC28_07990 [Spirochaeta lutea]
MKSTTEATLPFLPKPKTVSQTSLDLAPEIILLGEQPDSEGLTALAEGFQVQDYLTPLRHLPLDSQEAKDLLRLVPAGPVAGGGGAEDCRLLLQPGTGDQGPRVRAVLHPGSTGALNRGFALIVQAALFLKHKIWTVGNQAGSPGLMIQDAPRFELRGLHLDVSRHFFSREVVLELLYHMALVGLNRFHWHLTDDQGWRVPVEGFPELTVAGASRGLAYDQANPISPAGEDDPSRAYTREDIQAVLHRSRDLGITVVPEIDLPGHIQAAAAVVPGLACGHLEGKTPQGPWQDVGINPWAICPTGERSYQFIEKVMDSVSKTFGSTRIHLGGDECLGLNWQNCPDCRGWVESQGIQPPNREILDIHQWEQHPARRALYGEFVRRIIDLAEQKGFDLELWDDVLEVIPKNHGAKQPAGGQPEAGQPKVPTLFCWHADAVDRARGRGYPLVSCPETLIYFDHPQSPAPEEPGPKHFDPNVSTLGDILAWQPPKDVVGLQGCIWTEVMVTRERLEYMLFPRLWGLAQQAWNPGASDESSRGGEKRPQWTEAWADLYDALGVRGNWDREKW